MSYLTLFYSEAEGELSLSAGDYILVWGSGEPQGGYFDAELLDGRRGLVPASFVQRLIGLTYNYFTAQNNFTMWYFKFHR